MNTLRLTTLIASIVGAAAILHLPSCDRKPEPAPAATDQAKDAAKPSEGHHHGGAVIDLGAATIGTFEVKASRDEGTIEPGKDAPIDLTATPATASASKITVVRLWIGTQDAKGSIKARAEIENPKEPNRWHTHAEIPNPLPPGSKLWVEIETEKGEKTTGSFDLKS